MQTRKLAKKKEKKKRNNLKELENVKNFNP
jgi:hypothetical protein